MKTSSSSNYFDWEVPVPLKRGNFVSITGPTPSANNWIIADDLPLMAASEIGFADRQTPLLAQSSSQIGSGRAIRWKKVQLKGPGVTPLASFTRHTPLLHRTGHLLPSGAIREFLLSRTLARLGYRELCVSSKEVLLAPLDREIAIALRNWEKKNKNNPRFSSPGNLDRHWKGLLVRSSSPLRLSHLNWALESGKISPALAYKIAVRSHTRALRSHRIAWQIGLFFCSYENNLDLEGRFIDLETPLWLPPCFTGFLTGTLRRNYPSILPHRAIPVGKQFWVTDWEYRAFFHRLETHYGVTAPCPPSPEITFFKDLLPLFETFESGKKTLNAFLSPERSRPIPVQSLEYALPKISYANRFPGVHLLNGIHLPTSRNHQRLFGVAALFNETVSGAEEARSVSAIRRLLKTYENQLSRLVQNSRRPAGSFIQPDQSRSGRT